MRVNGLNLRVQTFGNCVNKNSTSDNDDENGNADDDDDDDGDHSDIGNK